MAQLLILLLTRHTYGWHQTRAYRSVSQLREQMGCDPRTFRFARELAESAGFLTWGKEYVRGICRTWWTLQVPAACATWRQDLQCKNAPDLRCKNALSHVTKEKDQRKHHQQADLVELSDRNDDDLLIDLEEDPGTSACVTRPTESQLSLGESSIPYSHLAAEKEALMEASSDAGALKVSPAAAGLLEELRSWGINGRIAARIVHTQPTEKLERALQSIRERPNVRNPAGWLVAECVAAEAYALPGATRAALMQQREAEQRASRRAQEKASKQAESEENDRHLEMVGLMVAELGLEERAELEDLAKQRVRRLSSKAGLSADCPILQAEFRNLVLERKAPKPVLASSDGSRWGEFRQREFSERMNRDGSAT